jgi:mannose-6-phosphate isomerase-like protein (cupin superfamily)
MENIVDIKTALSELDRLDSSSYFLDIMHTNSFEVGILKLRPGQKDAQGPHSADELYFIVEGEGFIRIQGTDHGIRKGSCVFVASKTEHHFHGNTEQLIVLYIFTNNRKFDL